MKKGKIRYDRLLALLSIGLVLVFMAGCNGTPSIAPIINSFSADPTTITVGESSTLSWSVTDATSVTIDQGIGNVALTGTTTVSPATTTTYTLTATNSTGSVTASVTITVGLAYGSIDVNSTPVGAKVYLDGEDTGQVTPIVLTNIEVGNHTIKLDLFHWKIWEDTTVNVVANETTYLNGGLVPAPGETITLQPGPEGIDSGIESVVPNSNYGNLTYCDVGNSAITIRRTYIKFDLSTVPANAVVVDADLKLYHYGGPGTDDFTIGLYNVTSAWDESTITWNLQPTCSIDAEITSDITAGAITWESWDIDTLVHTWLDGSITNYGVVLKDTDEALINSIAYFRSSDYTTDISKRPELVIDYYIP
jgi:hypothetical protein